MGSNLVQKHLQNGDIYFLSLSASSCLASPFPTPSPTSHEWIPLKILTSASRCFSICHCCSPRLREWAGSVFRSSCFSKVTAASYSPSVKSSGRNSPVSPLPLFFPVTYKDRSGRVRSSRACAEVVLCKGCCRGLLALPDLGL